MSGSDFRDWDILHYNEVPGRDIRADDQGLWRDIAPETHSGRATQFQIHAGPILHRGKLVHITGAFVFFDSS
jgi:ribonuclease Z